MRIQIKSISFLAFLTVLFITGIYFYQIAKNKEAYLIFRANSREKATYFSKLMKIKATNLETLSIDYTYWDEMVDFIHKNDIAWAQKMMDETVLKTYQADGIWVYRADYSPIYSITSQDAAGIKEFPLSKEDMKKIFSKDRLVRFFLNTDTGLMEINAATVHPTADPKRETVPQGYFFGGRLWKKGYIDELTDLAGGAIKATAVKQAIPDEKTLLNSNSIVFSKVLMGWEGKPVAYVYVTVHSKELEAYRLASRNLMLVIVGFFILIIIIIAVFLAVTVSFPIGIISKVLRTEDPAALTALERDTSEFGDISLLISKSFGQTQELLREMQERKEIEGSLRESEAYLKTIFDSLQIGIILIDAETHRIVDANPVAARLFGAPKERIIGEVCHKFICPTEDGKCPITDFHQQVDNAERILITADGHELVVIKTVVSIMLKNRKLFLESFVDVSERKKLEDEKERLIKELEDSRRAIKNVAEDLRESRDILEYQKKSLEDTNKELDDFTYIVSHDLKEPLRSIDAYSKFIADDYKDKLDEEGRHYVERIRANAERMKKLIEDLLELSRLKRQGSTIDEAEVDELISEVKTRLEYSIKEKGASIVIKDKLPKIFCDRVRLTEVFLNLISNAIKFNDKDKPVIEIGCNDKGDVYEFYVKDNGIGIQKEYFGKIFEIFQRLGKREDAEGTGAGLTIVKKIIQMHKGEIWLESTPGEGSIFHFTIPKDKSVILGKKLIGEILIEKKLVTEEELKKALDEQRKIAYRIGKGGQDGGIEQDHQDIDG